MIISIDAEKAFEKIQHPFMIKTSQKIGIEGTYLNIVKAIYDKPTENVILNGEKLKAFPQDQEQDKGVHFHQYYSTQFQKSKLQQLEKKKKRNPDRKRSETLFTDDMIQYIENPKETVRELLELISEFSKVAGYMVNTQKSLAFLYTNNEKSEKLRNQFHSPLQQKE